MKKSLWQEVISSKENKKENEKVFKIIKNILKVSIPMSLCSLFSATTKTIDALTVVRFLKNIIGIEEATIQYGILNGKVDTLIMLPLSFNVAISTTLIPTLSKALAKNEIKTVINKIQTSILITLAIGILSSVILYTFSDLILKILFPKAQLGSLMLKISSWTIIFTTLTQTINAALQGIGKVNTPVIAFAIGCVIKFILNVLLIPLFKINGAIYSSIISNIIIFLICYIELKRKTCLKFKNYVSVRGNYL